MTDYSHVILKNPYDGMTPSALRRMLDRHKEIVRRLGPPQDYWDDALVPA